MQMELVRPTPAVMRTRRSILGSFREKLAVVVLVGVIGATLVASGAAAGTVVVVEQNQIGQQLCADNNYAFPVGQSFVATETGVLTELTIWPFFAPFDGSPSPYPTSHTDQLSIHSGESPTTASQIHTQSVRIDHPKAFNSTRQTITMDSVVRLTKGTTYSFWFGTGHCWAGDYTYRFMGSTSDPYGGGSMLVIRLADLRVARLTNADLGFRLVIAPPPLQADAGGPYFGAEGRSLTLDASGTSGPGDARSYSYSWDVNGDGFFGDATGSNPTLSWAELQALGLGDGTVTVPIRLSVQCCGSRGETPSPPVFSSDVTSFKLHNAPPSVSAGPSQTVYRNDPVTLTGTWTDPAGSLDNPYTWIWTVEGSDTTGQSPHGSTITAATTFALPGTYWPEFQVTDKDGSGQASSVAIVVLNRPPDCSAAVPSLTTLSPPRRDFVPIEIYGVTDPEGDATTITIDTIFQDEAVDSRLGGVTTPDGRGVGTGIAEVRGERIPNGNGRVYHIGFTATDGFGATCQGEVLVGVPQFERQPAINDGAVFDSTTPAA
ncbi:MAG: hypothetical protein AB7W59_16715 [Acidimicrobiia bacterium]